MKPSALTLIEAARYGEHIARYLQEFGSDVVFDPMDQALSAISHRVDNYCLGLFHDAGFKHNLVVEPMGTNGVGATLQICTPEGTVLRTLRLELKAETADQRTVSRS